MNSFHFIVYIVLLAVTFVGASTSYSCLNPGYKPEREDDEPSIEGLDFVMPNGLVTPDFSNSGFRAKTGGIPHLTAANATIIQVPNNPGVDTKAIRDALWSALRDYPEEDWKVVQLEEGVYEIDDTIGVLGSNIVLRGAGQTRTTLYFTFDLQPHEIRLARPYDEAKTIYKWQSFLFYIDPFGLKRVEFRYNDKVFMVKNATATDDPANWCTLGVDSGCEPPRGNTQYRWTSGWSGSGWSKISNRAGEMVDVEVEAEWYDGTVTTVTETLTINGDWSSEDFDTRLLSTPSTSAVSLSGESWSGCCTHKLKVHGSYARGDRQVVATTFYEANSISEENYFAGKLVRFQCDMEGSWLDVTGEDKVSKMAYLRLESWRDATGEERTLAGVPAAFANAYFLTLAEPLPFRRRPVEDNWDVDCWITPEMYGTRNVGVQGFKLDFKMNARGPAEQLLVDGIGINLVDGGFVDDVHVHHAGDYPLRMASSYEVTVRDSYMNGTYYPHVGSRGYVSTAASTRVLWHNVSGEACRHIDITAMSSLCIMCRSKFIGSDPQAHQMWARENLLDASHWETDPVSLWYNPMVNWSASSGGYWNGIHMEVGTKGGHTPGGGPRWTFWNNRAWGGTAAMVLGGQNERHIIVGNRLHHRGAYQSSWNIQPAVEIWEQSFGHYMANNTILLAQTHSNVSAVINFFNDEHCGIRFKHNRFVYSGYMDSSTRPGGGAKLVSKLEAFAETDDNSQQVYDSMTPGSPLLWPSLYEYQAGLPGVQILDPVDDSTSIAFRGHSRMVKLRVNKGHGVGNEVDFVELFTNGTKVAHWPLDTWPNKVQVFEGVHDLFGEVMIESEQQELSAGDEHATFYELVAVVTDKRAQQVRTVWNVPIVVFNEYIQLPHTKKLGLWLRADATHLTLNAENEATRWYDRWALPLRDHRQAYLVVKNETVLPRHQACRFNAQRMCMSFQKDADDHFSRVEGEELLIGARPHGIQHPIQHEESLFIVLSYDDSPQEGGEIWSNSNAFVQVGNNTWDTKVIRGVRLRSSARNVFSGNETVPSRRLVVLNRQVDFVDRVLHGYPATSTLTSSMDSFSDSRSHFYTLYSSASTSPFLNVTDAEISVARLQDSMFVGGSFKGRDYGGEVAEIVFFRYALTPQERSEVHQYLESYYGVEGAPPLPDVPPLSNRDIIDTLNLGGDETEPEVTTGTEGVSSEQIVTSGGSEEGGESSQPMSMSDAEGGSNDILNYIVPIAIGGGVLVCGALLVCIWCLYARRTRHQTRDMAIRASTRSSQSSTMMMRRSNRHHHGSHRTSRSSRSTQQQTYQALPANVRPPPFQANPMVPPPPPRSF